MCDGGVIVVSFTFFYDGGKLKNRLEEEARKVVFVACVFVPVVHASFIRAGLLSYACIDCWCYIQ
jgi:hypothetical protein